MDSFCVRLPRRACFLQLLEVLLDRHGQVVLIHGGIFHSRDVVLCEPVNKVGIEVSEATGS